MTLASSVLQLGCASPGPTVRIGRRAILLGPIGTSAASQPAQITGYDDTAWQLLLLKHVAPGWTRPADKSTSAAGNGTEVIAEPPYPQLVEYRNILEHPQDLNAYLAVLAATGPATTPQSFPTDAHRLSYYLNAYNACAVRAALGQYPTETVYAPLQPAFEHDWYFQVDGRRENLDTLRQKASIAAAGDARFLFALSAASVGSPPLAPHPYQARDVYDELAAQAQLCLSMPQFVTISHDQQQLHLWWRMIRSSTAFTAWYEKAYGSPPASLLGVVMDLAPPRQREALSRAVGYKIVEVPFDRKLNDLVVRASATTTGSN